MTRLQAEGRKPLDAGGVLAGRAGRAGRDAGRDAPCRALAVEILVRVERDRAFAAPLLAAREGSLAPRDRPLLRTHRPVGPEEPLPPRPRPLPEPLAPARRARPGRPRRPPRRGRAAPPPRPDPGARRRRARRSRPSRRGRPRAAGLVNAVLRRVTREAKPPRVVLPPGTDPVARLALETSHPEWLVRRWVADLGPDAAEAALRADDDDAPVDVLLDPRGEDVERLRERLREEGLEGEPSPWAPLALTLSSPAAGSHPAIASGRLAVVDVAAQAMCELVEPADVVVDLAAAPGGKTRTLLARGKARRVVALERNPTRSRRLAAGLRGGGAPGRGPRRPRRLRAAAAAARDVSLRPPRRPLLGDGDAPEEPGDPLAPLAGRPPGARPRAAGAPPRRARPLRPRRERRLRHLLAGAGGERRRSSRPSSSARADAAPERPDGGGAPRAASGGPAVRTGSSGSLRAPQTTVSPPSSSERAEGTAEHAAFPLTRCGGNPTFQPFEQT